VDAQTLIDQAVAHSGLPARGDSWRPGLDLFLKDFNASQTVSSVGLMAAKSWVIDTLTARFAIEDWIVKHPHVADAPVKRPIFICGLPRAGTTLLFNLLAFDPQHRVYWNWEANREAPPVEIAHLHDDPRIARKVAEVNAALASGALDHRQHVEMGDEPGECAWLMAQDFKSYAWLILTAAPNYFEWFYQRADMVAAYRHHKRGLQVMQSRAPGQWMVKFPTHAPFLDALLTVYPDARIVLTHRDPLRPLGSSCAASYHFTKQFNVGLGPQHTGVETTSILKATLEQMCELRAKHPQVPVYDMHYLRFVADPLREMHSLYEFFEERLSESVLQKMQVALDSHNLRRAEIGPNRYSLAEFGIAADRLPRVFADYARQFAVQPEAA
jgi:hypothetical protein